MRARRLAIALVGLRGAGKSAVGAALAAELGRAFVDTDVELARRAGVASAGALLVKLGEPAFRELEAVILAEVLARADHPVVATGGGCIERRGSRALLRSLARCVWLRADPLVLATRIRADAVPRPALLGGSDPCAELELMLARRAPLYAEVAEREVDASVESAASIARALAHELSP